MLAKKRVIDCTEVASSDFDELSFMAQALYVRLVADTDDMGVAEAGAVVRNATRMRLKALDELIDGGFVTLIRDKGKIVYINGFHDGNTFTRYGARESRYMTELLHNDYTKNVINTVKIKGDGNHKIGNAMNGEATTGEVVLCNAERYDKVAQDHSQLNDYDALRYALRQWYEYTDEVGKAKTSNVSINNMINNAVKRCESVGEYEVVQFIDTAISNTWNNLSWDWFDNKPFK